MNMRKAKAIIMILFMLCGLSLTVLCNKDRSMRVSIDDNEWMTSFDDTTRSLWRGSGHELVVTSHCAIGITLDDSISQSWEAIFVVNERHVSEDITQQVRTKREVVLEIPGTYRLKAVSEQGEVIDCYDWFCYAYHYDAYDN